MTRERQTPMTDVLLEHPATSARVTVRAAAVDGWARAGWTPVDTKDTQATPPGSHDHDADAGSSADTEE